MTTLFAGTELAAGELPDAVTGFGAAEIAYLLSRHDDLVIRKSAALVQPPDEQMTEYVRACGASSLLARGLAAVKDEQIETLSVAALFEYGALRAEQWTVVKRVDGRVHDGVIIFHTPETLVVVQPRSVGTVFVSYSDDVERPGEIVTTLVGELAAGDPAAEISVSTSRLDAEAPPLTLAWDAASERWRAGADDGETALLDDSALRVRVGALLTVAPPQPATPAPMPPRDPDEQARIASKFQDRLG